MTDPDRDATCSDCGARRPLDPGPCPECGSRKRSVPLGTVALDLSVGSLTVTKVREWVETNWPLLFTWAGLTAAGYLLAGWLGLLLAAATVPVGAGVFTKVREIER